MPTPITAFYAALLTILLVVFGTRVVLARRKNHVSLGDGGNQSVLTAIRIHGNAAENIPLILVLMLMLEYGGGSYVAMHAYGSTLLVGRLLHAWGLSQPKKVNLFRVAGMALTWLVALGLSVQLLIRAAPFV